MRSDRFFRNDFHCKEPQEVRRGKVYFSSCYFLSVFLGNGTVFVTRTKWKNSVIENLPDTFN